MAATRIDGKQIAEQMQSALAGRVQAFAEQYGFVPGLSVILVGDDPASEVYVRNKHRACAKVGIRSETTRMPAETTEAELLAEIDRQNADPMVQGILVQLPLPAHLRQDSGAHRARKGCGMGSPGKMWAAIRAARVLCPAHPKGFWN